MSFGNMFAGMGGNSAGEAQQWVRDGAKLIDVRSPAEYAGGHVRGAKNIPVQDLEGHLNSLGRGSRVVVYCQSGARSARAASILRSAGHDVIDVGSIYSWGNQGDIVR